DTGRSVQITLTVATGVPCGTVRVVREAGAATQAALRRRAALARTAFAPTLAGHPEQHAMHGTPDCGRRRGHRAFALPAQKEPADVAIAEQLAARRRHGDTARYQHVADVGKLQAAGCVLLHH